MGVKSISWWLDIEEYENGSLHNSFSAGPIARSWDDDGDVGEKFMTIQELVDEINELFEEAWDEGDGQTDNLYEVIPTLITSAETYSTTTAGQASIRFEFIRSYPIYGPKIATTKKFKIALRDGPHGSKTFQPLEPTYPAATITYSNDSAVKADTLPYWNTTAMITDKPPIAPDVVFVPFLGISNKILLLLDGNMGDLDLKPVIIKDSDTIFLAEELYSQLKLSVGESEVSSYIADKNITLNYRSDDPVSTYQIFKLTKKPTSYSDFNTPNNPIATVSEMVAPGKPSEPATYISTIRPNVKYYYCIRGVDVHGNISNPTEVFEIEMVDNNGQIFYTMSVLDWDRRFELSGLAAPGPGAKGTTTPSKCRQFGRRFIYIAPSLQQSIFNRDTFNNSAEVDNKPADIKLTDLPPSNMLGYLGAAEGAGDSSGGVSVWDKKFKIRVTSTKTGKKFDLNITVKNSGVNNP